MIVSTLAAGARFRGRFADGAIEEIETRIARSRRHPLWERSGIDSASPPSRL
jgi:hypothetical protein